MSTDSRQSAGVFVATSSSAPQGFVYNIAAYNALIGSVVDATAVATVLIVMPASDSATWRLYRNGERVDAGRTGILDWPTGPDRVAVGGLPRGGAGPSWYPGTYYVASWYSAALSADQAAAVHAALAGP
jgi:hypothetical protein